MHTEITTFPKAPQQENLTRSTGATVVAFDRSQSPLAREDFEHSIHHWIGTRNTAVALSRQDIGSMQGFDRVDAQRKAFLLGMAAFFRDNPRADVALGVYSIIMFMSDNKRGMCSMSQGRMAEILNRNRQTISDAMRRLRESGLILSENGKAGATPIIPRAVSENYNHVVWLMDAIATCPPQPTGPKQIEPAHSSRQVGGPVNSNRQVTCPLQPFQPVGSSGHKFTKTSSLEETTLERERESRMLSKALATGIAVAASSLPLAAAPMEPPAIVQTVKAEVPYDELKAKLMEAGGEAIGISAGLEVLAVPRRWLNAGCDLTDDILPAIRARAAKMPPRSINSWNYFEQAVADARAARCAPMPEGRAPTAPSRAKNWHDEQDIALAYIFRKDQ